MTVLLSILGACAYCFTSFVKKWEAGQKWNWSKFIATMIIGAVVGFIARATPLSEMTEQFVIGQLALYGGFTAVIENILKIIWRLFKKKR